MFAMSVNEVPGWSVLIVPRLIGVPVAATPGLVPHVEVSTEPELPLADAEEAAALVAAGALDDAAGAPLELERARAAGGEDAERQQRGCRGRCPRPPVDGSIHVFCLLLADSA